MIHHHCKTTRDHYWGVTKTTKPTLNSLLKAGIPRKLAAQHIRKCHNAVLLLAGDASEQVTILLTAEEARSVAGELLDKAKELPQRSRSTGRKAE